jgi:hypothetical protein
MGLWGNQSSTCIFASVCFIQNGMDDGILVLVLYLLV